MTSIKPPDHSNVRAVRCVSLITLETGIHLVNVTWRKRKQMKKLHWTRAGASQKIIAMKKVLLGRLDNYSMS